MRTSRGEPALVSDFFFFQAEDGIRDGTVTGVQTCALPICLLPSTPPPVKEPVAPAPAPRTDRSEALLQTLLALGVDYRYGRSEERRVGKECRSRWSRDH